MLSIVSAVDTDLPIILALNQNEYLENESDWKHLDKWQKYTLGMWWVDQELLNWHFQIINKSNGGILLAYVGDLLVGELDYIISKDHRDGLIFSRLHIIWVLIDKKARRKGYAEKLIIALKLMFPSEIWVEDEDIRSNNLYSKLGSRYLQIYNFEISQLVTKNILLHKNEFAVDGIEFSIIHDYQLLLDKLDDGTLLLVLGHYFAPKYDLNQLASPDPAGIIWGGMDPANIYHYMTKQYEVFAIITQYPRIYVSNISYDSNFDVILTDIFDNILIAGYENISIQIVHSPLLSVLNQFPLQKISDTDFIYKI